MVHKLSAKRFIARKFELHSSSILLTPKCNLVSVILRRSQLNRVYLVTFSSLALQANLNFSLLKVIPCSQFVPHRFNMYDSERYLRLHTKHCAKFCTHIFTF